MVYQLQSGDEIAISPAMVRRYLVQGRSDLVTDQEIIFFMHMCKARRLNPFLRECWLIKYSPNDPAQIVESIHHKRAQARRHPDCRGWKVGIIYQDKNGEICESRHPFLSDGARLMAGFFEAPIQGWDDVFRHEVSLQSVIKRKKDGSLTQFWSEPKQPQMLMKVAESQGMSIVFPGGAGATMIPEETQGMEIQDSGQMDEPEEVGTEIYEVTPEAEPVEQPADQAGEQENFFDNPRNMVYRQAVNFYLMIMIGRKVGFAPHGIIKEGGSITIDADQEGVYSKLVANYPEAVGALDSASGHSKDILVKHLITKLNLSLENAEKIVKGNFNEAIEDLPKDKVAPGKEQATEAGMLEKIMVEFDESTIEKGISEMGLSDWPDNAKGMADLYRKCSEIQG
jgi:phage recombination protein Bet